MHLELVFFWKVEYIDGVEIDGGNIQWWYLTVQSFESCLDQNYSTVQHLATIKKDRNIFHILFHQKE